MSHRVPSRNHLFDALRGLAAVAVMLFHVTNIDRDPMLAGGYLAVDLFFLLSGFVLWNAYGARLVEGLSAGAFLRIRLVRLYPMFAIGMALGIVRALGAMHLGDPRAPTWPMLIVQTLATALLIPSGVTDQGVFPLDNPAWSLSLEVIVNIAFCLWMVRRPNRMLGMLCVVAAFALVMVALRFGSLDTGWKAANAIGGPIRCAFSFTLGVLMARRGIHAAHDPRSGRLLPYAILALVLAVIAFPPGAALRPWFDLACVMIVFPAIVALAANARMAGAGAWIATVLGDMSYPLYAIHYPLIRPAMVLCARFHIGGGNAIVAIAGLCLASAALLVPVDRVLRGWLGRRLQPGRPTTVFTSMKSARP